MTFGPVMAQYVNLGDTKEAVLSKPSNRWMKLPAASSHPALR